VESRIMHEKKAQSSDAADTKLSKDLHGAKISRHTDPRRQHGAKKGRPEAA
jgi:hypothetical protein